MNRQITSLQRQSNIIDIGMQSIKDNKRSRENYDSGTENDHNITPPKRAKHARKATFIVKSKEMQSYFLLLEDAHIVDFLCADGCKRISDKYLLAMVFAYFKRAGYGTKEFTKMNFFKALEKYAPVRVADVYLANDMEEDEEDYKYEIFPWALGKSWKKKYVDFLRKKEKLWAKIGYRAVVSRKCCEEVMAIDPSHWVWQRDRPEYHVGAIRCYARDPDDDGYPRGPDASPLYCRRCAQYVEYDSASLSSISWYLSSSADSLPDEQTFLRSIAVVRGDATAAAGAPAIGAPAVGVPAVGAPAVGVPAASAPAVAPPGGRFNMEGLKQTLPEDDGIWALQEE